MKNSNVKGEEVLELMYDAAKRKSVPKSTRIETATGLLMQLLKSRERHNVDQDFLETNELELDSNQIRRIIQEDSCQILYDTIFSHMVKLIAAKKSRIDICAEYLAEALLNYKKATKIQKKNVEESIKG